MAVSKEKNGTWTVQVYIKDWTGQSIHKKKRGFATKREALEWERRIKAQKASFNMTLDEFVDVYFEDKKTELKQRTIETKKHMLRTHVIPYFGEKQMRDISASDIIQWQNVVSEKGYKPTYLRAIQNQVTALFTHATRIYNLENNPCSKVKKMGKMDGEKVNFWTYEEYESFIKNIEFGSRYYVLFETLFWTGMREGELLALQKSDINLVTNQISIDKTYYRRNRTDYITTPKTEQSIRTIDIPEFLTKELEEYMSKIYGLEDKDRIFPIVAEAVQQIRQSKQEKLFHELIVQIGNKEDSSSLSSDSFQARLALQEYMSDFQKRNPNLRVFNAVLHMDEPTPHLHIDFVPFSTGNKRGLETKVSLKGALKAQGFEGTGRHDTEWGKWVASEKACLAEIMEKYQLKWLQKGTHEKHLSAYDYEKKMRMQEVREWERCETNARERYQSYLQLEEKASQRYRTLAKEKDRLDGEVSDLKEQIDTVTKEKKVAQEELETAEIERDGIKTELEQLVSRYEKMQKDIRNLEEQSQEIYQKYRQISANNRQYEIFEDMVQLKQENAQLKEENRILREKLQQAYDFMKQFVLNGKNMLEQFLESIGDRAQHFAERIGGRR